MYSCGTCVNPDKQLSLVKQLLSYGAEIDTTDNDGLSAVFHAIESYDPEVLKLLIHHHARIDLVTHFGDTLLHFAIIYLQYLTDVKATLQAIKTMPRAQLNNINIKHRNTDGDEAFDLLKKRNSIKWGSYLRSKFDDYNYCLWSFYRFRKPCSGPEKSEIIYEFEAFLHEIQDAQGVPKEEQYPPLGEYLSSNTDDAPVPGAWPV